MTPSATEAYIRHWLEEVWNRGNAAVVREAMPANYVLHNQSGPYTVSGGEAFVQFNAAFRTAFPDLTFVLEDIIEAGDTCAWRWTAHGTNLGPLPGGIPATGRTMTMGGIVISRISNGQWLEDWVNWDELGMLRQLGVIPSPEAVAA